MDQAAISHPFVRELIGQIRACDSFGIWANKSDDELIAPFILDAEKRAHLPIMGDPDPKTLGRIDRFYAAVALRIERRSGLIASPISRISNEGFGRVLLTCGRLVVMSKNLRDMHRFGFASVEKLAEKGEVLVEDALQWIARFPEAANA